MTRVIIITPVLNGYVCDVGCQRVVFTDKQTLLHELSGYYDKPEETEKRYIERAVNKMQPGPCQIEAQQCENRRVPNPEYAVTGLR